MCLLMDMDFVKSMPMISCGYGGAYYSDTACECISAIYNNKNSVMVVKFLVAHEAYLP